MCNPAELPWNDFPHGACGDVSLILGQILSDEGIEGFEYIGGKKYNLDSSSKSHGWLRKDQWIVDITADQFVDVFEPVIVTTDEEWYSHWVQEQPEPGTLDAYGEQIPWLCDLHSLLKDRLRLQDV